MLIFFPFCKNYLGIDFPLWCKGEIVAGNLHQGLFGKVRRETSKLYPGHYYSFNFSMFLITLFVVLLSTCREFIFVE